MYFYIQTNKDWDYERKYKYGVTANPYERVNKTDQHSYRSKFIKLYEYQLTDKYKSFISSITRSKFINIDDIIKKYNKFNNYIPLLSSLSKHLIKHGGGTEFIYESGLELLKEIIINEFPKIGIIITVVDENDIQRINDLNNDYDSYDNSSDDDLSDDYCCNIIHTNFISYDIKPRDYQIDIISQLIEIFHNKNKVYLSLATGAGKSFITYSIIDYLLEVNAFIKTVIILTPRINICEQNVSDKYISLLKKSNLFKSYNKDNLFTIESDNYNLICCCINSYKKVYSVIINKNLSNVIIWFDEAHYGIDNWINQFSNNQKQFLLTDNNQIKYRLFTSASPNKDFVSYNDKIFGDLINPYKVCDLMNNYWLCPLEVYIYKEYLKDCETKIDTETFVKFIFNEFNEKEKTAGLCFCNSCDNAVELFKYQIDIYDKNNKIIPFLLLNDSKIKELSKYKFPDNLLSINDFDASNDINKPNKNKRLANIVQMYSMGYDNRDIDFLVFKDPKLSYKDIIQSIGRGLRSDCKGTDGKNLNKKTTIILPVYINSNDDANRFDKIKEVLKYLIMDVELSMKNIKIISNPKKKPKKETKKDEEDFSNFRKEIETMIYDIRKALIKWDLLKITKQLKHNKINNYNDYLRYINENKDLNLPENLFKDFPDFDFSKTYPDNNSPYYSKMECIEAIKKLKRLLLYNPDKIDKNNNLQLLRFLHSKDPKIPNECLWTYYGGSIKDYIIFNEN